MENEKKVILLALIVSLSALISGCGQGGPLYLPGTKPPIHTAPTEKPHDD